MKKHILFLVVIVFSFLINSSNVTAETSDYNPIISFDDEQGIKLETISSISGYIEDEIKPNSIWWTLYSDSAIFNSDIITDDISFFNTSNNRTQWSFNIFIDYEISSCTCYLEIYVQTISGQIFNKILSFYIDDGSDLTPALVIDKDAENSWYSEYFHISGFTNQIDNSLPHITYAIKQLTQNIDCDDTTLEEYKSMDYSQLPLDGDANVIENSGYFHSSINLENYIDGSYIMYVGSSTENSSNEGLLSLDCIKFRIDKTSPSVSINGMNIIIEGSDNIIFDASESIDPEWGRSDLYYIWTFSKNSSFENSPVFIKSGRELTSINIPTNISGDFKIKLQIIDKAGNIGSTNSDIIIDNIPPFIRLNVNGESTFDGDTINIEEGESIYLDASDSSDTINDANSLRYIWKINNIPTFEGSIREIEWPEGINDNYVLTLEVIDNDNEASTISINIGNRDGNSSFNTLIFVLLGSFAFLIFSISSSRRKRENIENIPKWV